jgi:hypothetical protein
MRVEAIVEYCAAALEESDRMDGRKEKGGSARQ